MLEETVGQEHRALDRHSDSICRHGVSHLISKAARSTGMQRWWWASKSNRHLLTALRMQAAALIDSTFSEMRHEKTRHITINSQALSYLHARTDSHPVMNIKRPPPRPSSFDPSPMAP